MSQTCSKFVCLFPLGRMQKCERIVEFYKHHSKPEAGVFPLLSTNEWKDQNQTFLQTLSVSASWLFSKWEHLSARLKRKCESKKILVTSHNYEWIFFF